MAFNTSGLTAYVQNNSKQIATQAIAGAKTAKLLIDNKQVQVGVKGSAAILKMNSGISFQDGSACGRTALGTTTVADKVIVVKPIKDVQNFCPKTLYGTFYATMISQGQDPTNETFDAAFAQSLMGDRAARVANGIENLIWKGDTTSSDINLNKIDGFLKQISASSDHIALTETGSTLVEKMQNFYLQMVTANVAVATSPDFRIFVGADTYAKYLVAKANKNIFQASDDVSVFGTPAVFEVLPGLNGSNAVVAGRISDLQLGLDGTDDADKAVLKESMETEQWYMDFHFAVGVSAVYTSQIGYVALA